MSWRYSCCSTNGTPVSAARDAFAPRGNFLRRGEKIHIRGLAETLRSFGEVGSEPFTTGRFAHMQAEVIEDMGGLLTAEDLAAYRQLSEHPYRRPTADTGY